MKAEDPGPASIWELVDARMGLERTKNDRGYRKGTVAHGIDHMLPPAEESRAS